MRQDPAEKSALTAVMVFPLIIVGVAAWALISPSSAGHLTPHINQLLGVIMFGMGLTLTVQDFKLVLTRPRPILVGVVAQFILMPLLAVLVAHVLRLSPAVTVGVILVGCAPGGTASNVIAYLARVDVALSVTMTAVSTILAPIFTPLLTKWLAGAYMPLDALGMAGTIARIVLIPVIGGLTLRMLLPRAVERVLPVLPWFSTVGVALAIAGVVAASSASVKTAGAIILLAVVIHNLLGFVCGFGFAWLLGVPGRAARTVSIEVGMQNSGLAAGLATTYFTPEAALPGAVFSIWHNLSGAVLAAVYRRIADREIADRARAWNVRKCRATRFGRDN
ncbi:MULTISPECIES: bile acid:sodium symporter family protein [unclassified Actinobaculum]|uniref:bile acid:sodium symporter family protein n=1 Tax=unclassified Actinobaculum TaxID=2609299 RepID=UPI000D528503|nr:MULTISPECIES: bile acid:sodium symporter family protein [unclassified Actinobaculum]AWE41954.1 Bile acid:sodium symporter [Actinobaculum sp. 313]RTE50131.1 bile acid:sodium symporter family protein [Actinobaculum sp. 352]